jgi:serine-type D-Ala-D-Ala carboxypeptidase/endopeptidase (penicillin-binding protein 4)
LCLLYTSAFASLEKDIKAILKTDKYKNVSTSIVFNKIGPKKENIFSINETKPLIPASLMKIVLSASVINYFGEDFRFHTPVYAKQYPQNGHLNSNLYIVGVGDPALKYADFVRVAKKLKKLGIHTINGSIIYNDTLLDSEPPRYPPNAKHYYTPPSALNVNYNTVELNIRTSPNAIIYPKLRSSYVRLDLSDAVIKNSRKAGRPKLTYTPIRQGDSYKISGLVTPADKDNFYLNVSVSKPSLYAAKLLQKAIRKEGIKIGAVYKGDHPVLAIELAQIRSKKIKNIVYTMNQDSNNLIAEVLNKDLGAYFHSIPGTRSKGLAKISEFFNRITGSKTAKIADASGLSKQNKISAHDINTFFEHIFTTKQLYNNIYPSLVRQGIHQLHSDYIPPEHLDIRLKTGTLAITGVNTVSGFINNTNTNEIYSFTIMSNRNTPGAHTPTATLTTPLLKKLIHYISTN